MAKSIISNNPAQLVTKARANLTDWTSYTPTIQGLGTVTSLQADWIQIGSKIHVKGYFTVGTPTAEEIQVSLPNTYTVGGSITNGVVPTGKMLIHGSSNTRLHFLSTFGDSFVNIGTEFRTAVSNGENPVLGNAVLNPGQTVSFDFEVPVQELSGSDVTFLAKEPSKNKIQTKTLSANVGGSGTASDLTFNNLKIGKLYRIGGHARFNTTNQDFCIGQLTAVHDGANIADVRHRTRASAGFSTDTGATIPFNHVFKATASSLTFTYAMSNTNLEGNGTTFETHVQLTELNNTEETDEF